ncbi:MAG: nucleoside/nucleotide kinase family protein [Pseudomonadota bacterium]
MRGPDPQKIDAVVDLVLALPEAQLRHRVCVVGAPGSGKSTFAAALVRRLAQRRATAALVPMDGFHLDNAILAARGLLARKGAPETFDAHGFIAMVERLGRDEEVFVPVFDRARDIAIAGASAITADTGIAVIEGNYLLLKEAPWSALHDMWDFSVYLDESEDILRRRLIQRWLDHGLSIDAARRRAETNDLPNARRVLENSQQAAFTV